MESPEGWRWNQTQVKPWRMTASLAAACSCPSERSWAGYGYPPRVRKLVAAGPLRVYQGLRILWELQYMSQQGEFLFWFWFEQRESWPERQEGWTHPWPLDWHPALSAGRAMGNPTSATALPGDLAVSRAMTAPWASSGPQMSSSRSASGSTCCCPHWSTPVRPCRSLSPQHPFLMFVLSFMLSTCVHLSSNEMSCLFPGLLFIPHWSVTRAEIV